ncbi:bacillithiol system redox-active protein YtxJ [Flavihumibacter profundi]|uniref:bacillithiol system redox-active protein YtxJ n=1 Tax=Flavihumibacter profundi TaxID=2716883 RepID=UPI001CC4A3C8|nr:bacillithiol system redox-active protein YtxJ [Flavihumibacter profundi]MBZ5855714.1 bacillithiol system redox-active protein YtxJ [Flavihumibacter profundi]
MQWIELKDPAQLAEIRTRSFSQPQVIFKHSTRCSISSMAKSRLERANPPTGVDFYFLDLIKHRSISNQIAEDFKVWHESPQLILIDKGECAYDESHSGITMDELVASIPK